MTWEKKNAIIKKYLATDKKIQKIFNEIWDYVSYIPCEFDCEFDNISVYKWENNTWVLHKEFLLS